MQYQFIFWKVKQEIFHTGGRFLRRQRLHFRVTGSFTISGASLLIYALFCPAPPRPAPRKYGPPRSSLPLTHSALGIVEAGGAPWLENRTATITVTQARYSRLSHFCPKSLTNHSYHFFNMDQREIPFDGKYHQTPALSASIQSSIVLLWAQDYRTATLSQWVWRAEIINQSELLSCTIKALLRTRPNPKRKTQKQEFASCILQLEQRT